MKKLNILFLFFLVLPLPLTARPSSIQNVDFSSARMSIAGPDTVYIRGVGYDGETYSVTVKSLNPMGTEWKITQIYPETGNYAPADTILDFISITPEADNILRFSGIISDGMSFSASLTIDQTGKLAVREPLHEAAMPEGFEKKLGSFKDLFTVLKKEQYEERISELRTVKEALSGAIEALRKDKKSQSETIGQLREKISELEQSRAGLQQKISGLEQKAASETEAAAQPSVPLSSSGKTVLEGFSRTIPQSGSWEVEKNSASQTDAGQYFSNLILPIHRQTKPALYKFSTRSRGKGWVGTGIYFSAPGRDGKLGDENTVLVWLTRDKDFYGTDDTRLQLYRTDENVQMEMVLDTMIDKPLGDFIDLAILFDPAGRFISISVNGIEKLRYKIWFSSESGLEIALRALGEGADFRDLQVLAAE